MVLHKNTKLVPEQTIAVVQGKEYRGRPRILGEVINNYIAAHAVLSSPELSLPRACQREKLYES